MKRNILTIAIVTVLMAPWGVAGVPVMAHGTGPPYVKINGEYALTNPILNLARPAAFSVGADVATSSGYLVGQVISFDIDEQFFPNPYLQAQSPFGLPVANVPDAPEPKFQWDFRDGTPLVEGKTARHTFEKPGTYLVDLKAMYVGKTEEFTGVNTIQMNIFPEMPYSLPVPEITVNGKRIVDVQRETAQIKPMKPVTFEATSGQNSSVTYQWDFGDFNDQKGAEGSKVTHRYPRDSYFPVVVLRATDENRLSADTYVLLDMPFEKPNVILRAWYAVSDFIRNIFYKD